MYNSLKKKNKYILFITYFITTNERSIIGRTASFPLFKSFSHSQQMSFIKFFHFSNLFKYLILFWREKKKILFESPLKYSLPGDNIDPLQLAKELTTLSLLCQLAKQMRQTKMCEFLEKQLKQALGINNTTLN